MLTPTPSELAEGNPFCGRAEAEVRDVDKPIKTKSRSRPFRLRLPVRETSNRWNRQAVELVSVRMPSWYGAISGHRGTCRNLPMLLAAKRWTASQLGKNGSADGR
jgi:hypothetical protein